MRPQEFNELRKFYQHRLAINPGDDSTKETPEFWDSMAESFAKKAHSPEERRRSQQFLDRFSWEKGETVLDVACGPGTFAIPLALRGCKVTATDFSTQMLCQLKKFATKENCPPIDCLQGRWLETNIEDKFDTVLCMSGLGVISTDSAHNARLAEALKKLYKLANKRLIILVPHADSHLDARMKQIIGEDEVPIERLRIALIYYAMVDCGMLPSLLIIKKPFKWLFKDVEEACSVLLKKSGIKRVDPDKYEALKEYVSSIAVPNDKDCLTVSYSTPQALFVIEK